jgi:tetratricopeptide (TPR) repeat protein
MYTRTREAVKFLEKCKETVAPFLVAFNNVQAKKKLSSEDAACLADALGVDEDDAKAEASKITGADVVSAMELLRNVQTSARTYKQKISVLERDLEASEARRLKDASNSVSSLEVAEQRARADALLERNNEQQARIDSLNKQLNDATLAVTKATRAAAASSSLSVGAARETKEDEILRSRVRELEQQLSREKEEAAAALRAEKLSSARELTLEKERSSRAVAAATMMSASQRSTVVSPRGDKGDVSTTASAATPAGTGSTQLQAPSSLIPGGGDSSLLYEAEWAPFLLEAQRLERDGAFADAEQQFEAVLEIKRERSGNESVPVASACRDLGRVLALQRRFDKAEDHYSLAVRLCSKLLGESHPNTACALTDLAAVLREQGKFEQAEEFATRAVASLRAGVGADDVSTATALYNLAGLAKRQGKFRAAEDSYAEALRIFREKLGDGQGETADTLYQMGCLFRKRNEVAKAGQFFSQAAEAYSKTYGPSDKRVIESQKRAKGMAEKGNTSTTTSRM